MIRNTVAHPEADFTVGSKYVFFLFNLVIVSNAGCGRATLTLFGMVFGPTTVNEVLLFLIVCEHAGALSDISSRYYYNLQQFLMRWLVMSRSPLLCDFCVAFFLSVAQAYLPRCPAQQPLTNALAYLRMQGRRKLTENRSCSEHVRHSILCSWPIDSKFWNFCHLRRAQFKISIWCRHIRFLSLNFLVLFLISCGGGKFCVSTVYSPSDSHCWLNRIWYLEWILI